MFSNQVTARIGTARERFIEARVQLDETTGARWRRLLADKNVAEYDALRALVRWLLRQDTLLQSIVLGQVPERDHPRVLQMIYMGAIGD